MNDCLNATAQAHTPDKLSPYKRLYKKRPTNRVKKGKRGAVDRRLRRYYLIVRLLPNVFALACLSLSSI